MKTIAETGLLTLNWIQSGFINRKYALFSGEHQVASLYWNKGKKPGAVGEAATGKWLFQSSRVLYPRVSIKAIEPDRLVATFEATLKGSGNLALTDGRKYRWLSTDFWNNEWVFTDARGERLLQFIPEQGLFKIGAQVILEPQTLDYPELPLLAITGWYLLVNINKQDSDLSSLAWAVKVK
jgi:hypothetical protein